MNAEDADKSERRAWLLMAATTLHRTRNSFHPRSLRSSAVNLFMDSPVEPFFSEVDRILRARLVHARLSMVPNATRRSSSTLVPILPIARKRGAKRL